AASVAGVVKMVRVAVPPLAPLIKTGLLDPKLKVGRFRAPIGLEVIAAVSATVPVNPGCGVTVIVEVFPVIPPALTVVEVPEIAKPGAVVTATKAVFEVPQ